MTNNNWEECVKRIQQSITIYHSDGMEHVICPICGINIEELDRYLTQKDQEHKADLEIIKGEIKEYFEGLIHVASPRLTGNNIVSIIDSHINKLTPPSPEDKEIK